MVSVTKKNSFQESVLYHVFFKSFQLVKMGNVSKDRIILHLLLQGLQKFLVGGR